MSILDCKFEFSSNSIFPPFGIDADTVYEITLTNQGSALLENLGFHLIPATSIGDVDNPADFPRETDYQDILTWGSKTVAAVTVSGGLKITYRDPDDLEQTDYFTRDQGANHSNRILIKSLDADESTTFELELETPPGAPTRRCFVTLVLSQ